MSVRGRSDRMAFAESFHEIYHFRLLYSGTTFMFPILGAIRMTTAGSVGPPTYVLHQRWERGDRTSGSEQYFPVASFVGREPTPEEITKLVPREVRRF